MKIDGNKVCVVLNFLHKSRIVDTHLGKLTSCLVPKKQKRRFFLYRVIILLETLLLNRSCSSRHYERPYVLKRPNGFRGVVGKNRNKPSSLLHCFYSFLSFSNRFFP